MKKYEVGLLAVVVVMSAVVFVLGISKDYSFFKRDGNLAAPSSNIGAVDLSSPDGRRSSNVGAVDLSSPDGKARARPPSNIGAVDLSSPDGKAKAPPSSNIGAVDLSSPDGKAKARPSDIVSPAPQVSAVYRAVSGLWMLWSMSWLLASGWTARTVKSTRPGERALEHLCLLAGGCCLGLGLALGATPQLGVRLYSLGALPAWVLVAFVACGFAVCWWARLHLGRMWSSAITLKTEHRIIDTGPYAIVRHPIYAGILLAAWATAALDGIGLPGAALMTIAYYLKARREELLLTAELGEPYESYRHRVPMLLPFLQERMRTANLAER